MEPVAQLKHSPLGMMPQVQFTLNLLTSNTKIACSSQLIKPRLAQDLNGNMQTSGEGYGEQHFMPACLNRTGDASICHSPKDNTSQKGTSHSIATLLSWESWPHVAARSHTTWTAMLHEVFVQGRRQIKLGFSQEPHSLIDTHTVSL